jgi:hypothetical protein
MRRRLVWLLVGAAMATIGTVVIPAWANTLSEERARDKTKDEVLDELSRNRTIHQRTRASVDSCQRLKLEDGSDDPHRIRCRGRARYYFQETSGSTISLPSDRTCFVTVRKKHSSGKVVVQSSSC